MVTSREFIESLNHGTVSEGNWRANRKCKKLRSRVDFGTAFLPKCGQNVRVPAVAVDRRSVAERMPPEECFGGADVPSWDRRGSEPRDERSECKPGRAQPLRNEASGVVPKNASVASLH